MTNKQLIARLKKLPPDAQMLFVAPAMAVEHQDVPGFSAPIVRWRETAAAMPIRVVESMNVEGAGRFVVLAETLDP
jgi:hypothetical protein